MIDSVLAENRDRSPVARRDDLSDDDDDDDLQPAANGGNPLKDFTFMGGAPLKPVPKQPAKKLDSVTAIRDYLETELG